MGANQSTENKSLEPVKAEDKAAKAAVETKVAEVEESDTVKFVVAHPIAKNVLVADAEGEHNPGDEVEVPRYVAEHFARVGAGRLA